MLDKISSNFKNFLFEGLVKINSINDIMQIFIFKNFSFPNISPSLTVSKPLVNELKLPEFKSNNNFFKTGSESKSSKMSCIINSPKLYILSPNNAATAISRTILNLSSRLNRSKSGMHAKYNKLVRSIFTCNSSIIFLTPSNSSTEEYCNLMLAISLVVNMISCFNSSSFNFLLDSDSNCFTNSFCKFSRYDTFSSRVSTSSNSESNNSINFNWFTLFSKVEMNASNLSNQSCFLESFCGFDGVGSSPVVASHSSNPSSSSSTSPSSKTVLLSAAVALFLPLALVSWSSAVVALNDWPSSSNPKSMLSSSWSFLCDFFKASGSANGFSPSWLWRSSNSNSTPQHVRRIRRSPDQGNSQENDEIQRRWPEIHQHAVELPEPLDGIRHRIVEEQQRGHYQGKYHHQERSKDQSEQALVHVQLDCASVFGQILDGLGQSRQDQEIEHKHRDGHRHSTEQGQIRSARICVAIRRRGGRTCESRGFRYVVDGQVEDSKHKVDTCQNLTVGHQPLVQLWINDTVTQGDDQQQEEGEGDLERVQETDQKEVKLDPTGQRVLLVVVLHFVQRPDQDVFTCQEHKEPGQILAQQQQFAPVSEDAEEVDTQTTGVTDGQQPVEGKFWDL